MGRSLHSKRAAKYSVRLRHSGRDWIVSTWDDWFSIFVDSEPMSREEALRVQAEHRQKVLNREVEGKSF